jgi:hypothetical protein
VNGLVVTVDFKLKPGAMAAFRKLIDEDAQMSCEREPGCGRFAVLVSKGANDGIFFTKSVMAARPSILTCSGRTSPHSTGPAPTWS